MEILLGNQDDALGESVSINFNGSIIAVPSSHRDGNTGSVQTYQWFVDEWIPYGDRLNGVTTNQFFGTSVSLNNAGNRLAIGSPNSGNPSDLGFVQIYDFDETTNSWQEIVRIESDLPDVGFGEILRLNADGNRVVIGAPQADETLNDNRGYTRVFEQQGANWVPVTDKIFGLSDDDQSPTSLSISADGSVVAIGDKLHDRNGGNNEGAVRILEQLATGDWQYKGCCLS